MVKYITKSNITDYKSMYEYTEYMRAESVEKKTRCPESCHAANMISIYIQIVVNNHPFF